MPRIHTYICDVCGTPKGPANHWWRYGTYCLGGQDVFVLSGFSFGQLLRLDGAECSTSYACGAECAAKAQVLALAALSSFRPLDGSGSADPTP